MIYPCDLELTKSLDSLTGLPKPGEEEEVAAILTEDTWPQFFKTPIGGELQEKYEWTEELNATIAREFARRFGEPGKIKGGVQWPGAFIVDRIEEVVGDLIRTKHSCLTLKSQYRLAATPQPTETERFDALKDQVRSDIDSSAVSSRDIESKKRDPNYKRAFDEIQVESVNRGYGIDPNAAPKAEAPAEIAKFAELLRLHFRDGGSVPRVQGGYFTLIVNGKRYDYKHAEFQELMEKAAAFDLVR
jgi:hypothetical protein